jgi:carboxypeptidase family protein
MRKTYRIAIALTLCAASPALAQERPRLPQGPAGTVTLPVAEYDRLVDRAGRPDTRPDPPPVPAVVARADLRARVAADMARGTLRLDGEVFHRGQVKVPLVTGATLLEARADGVPLPLVQEGDLHSAVLSGPAAFSLTLEWAAPVSSAPGRASIVLPSPAAGSVSATVDLPGDPADVRVEPGMITRRQTAGGRTTVDVTLDPGPRARVTWSVRETASPASQAQAETRTLADVKSLLTIGDADLRMVVLVDITVVRGEPRTFDVRLPAGYEVAAITGSSIETTDARSGSIAFTVRDGSQRRHQFLISLEQPHAPGSFKLNTSFPTVPGAQREVGETAIEGTGTIDVGASGDDGLRRMDVRETHPSLRSLARQPLLAAFRYQRRANETRTLTLDVKRFADAPVIAAVAERAFATTLVTVEGRTLSEVALTIRNRAQPFMKVVLPPGATLLSVDVAGEQAKPVLGTDGTRVPLLRPGFRPDGPYTVSFVYLHAGQPFDKRGEAQMTLPEVDVPVTFLEWELFLPDRFSAKPLAGNVIPARLVDRFPPVTGYGYATGTGSGSASGGGVGGGTYFTGPVGPGQLVGRITDEAGLVIPGVTVTVTGEGNVRRTAVTDANGIFTVHGVPSGKVTVTSELAGFSTARRSFTFDQRPRQVDFRMRVAALTETVTVESEAPLIDTRTSERRDSIRIDTPRNERRAEELQQAAPSQNILNLQQRVAGVLPVRVDVPRAGTAYRFVKPLVLDEETKVTFRYKTR